MKKYWMYVCAMASFFALAPLAMAYHLGNGYFSNTSIDMKYQVENGRVKIESITLGDWMPNDNYPCEAMLKQYGRGGTFKTCILMRSIKGAVTEHRYTNVKDLTRAQLVAFLTTTGDVGAASSDRFTYFTLGITTSRVSHGSYIPSNFNSEAGIIPPVEPPPPPLSCNIGSGTINHQVASTSVDRDSASTTVSVSCTGSTTVRVRALNYNPNNGGVTLNGPDTLKSLIAIDNTSAEIGTVKRVDYYRNFTVSSELRSAAKEIAGGEYSGSLIIVVTTE
ncbi:hypothetical protein [Serratia sp. (in: enterobacteria)]|uniref:MrpH family fimbial adhesin n=1 Tax=Serratia sp. (in: enterobacteria) TaxID=616 RepID=UPI003989DB00